MTRSTSLATTLAILTSIGCSDRTQPAPPKTPQIAREVPTTITPPISNTDDEPRRDERAQPEEPRPSIFDSPFGAVSDYVEEYLNATEVQRESLKRPSTEEVISGEIIVKDVERSDEPKGSFVVRGYVYGEGSKHQRIQIELKFPITDEASAKIAAGLSKWQHIRISAKFKSTFERFRYPLSERPIGAEFTEAVIEEVLKK